MYRTKTLTRSVLALGAGRAGARASRSASDENIIEQIIVTAQKRAHGAAGRAVLGGRTERRADPQRRREQHRGARPHGAGPRDHRSRPRPEPGRHARHQRRPGRARPAGREGAGRRVSRRVADLRGAVHAGPRPVRSAALRSAARTAGHAVRLRLDLRARCATSRRSRSSACSAAPSRRRLRRAPTASSADRIKGMVNVPRRRHLGAAHRRLSQRAAGIHRFRVPGPRQARGRQQRHRRAARASRG